MSLRENILKNETWFWAKVDKKTNNECWPWKGSTNGKGYGRVSMLGTRFIASRIAAYFSNEFDIFASEVLVCHKCDNRLCCNPDHLFIGSYKDNTQDMLAKGRQSTLHAEAHGKASLKNDQVLFIANSTLPCTKLAKMFNVSQNTIYDICKGRTWNKFLTNVLANKYTTTSHGVL